MRSCSAASFPNTEYIIEADDRHPGRHLENRIRRKPRLRRRARTDEQAPSREAMQGGEAAMAQEPRPFFAEQRSIDERVVVRIGGECDLATLDRLNKTLQAAVDQKPPEVVVDLAEATFVDSLTLAALTAAAQRVRAEGGSFRVRAVAAEVRRAFEMTGLDTYLLEPSNS
jgi:anti-sigma B factor antagonist